MYKEIKHLFGDGDSKKIILNNVKKNNGIVFGATASQIRMGANARPTRDVDAFVPNPRRVAQQTERQLDNNWGADQFYVKKAKHPKTWKVKDKGWDGQKGTDDDQTVADFSPMPQPVPQHSTIAGLKVVNLNHVQQTKSKSLQDPKFKYRHPKDSEDVERIRFFNGQI